jgi:hypothetical protein
MIGNLIILWQHLVSVSLGFNANAASIEQGSSLQSNYNKRTGQRHRKYGKACGKAYKTKPLLHYKALLLL